MGIAVINSSKNSSLPFDTFLPEAGVLFLSYIRLTLSLKILAWDGEEKHLQIDHQWAETSRLSKKNNTAN